MIKFTKEEKTAIIFVFLALFAGLTALYCKKNASPIIGIEKINPVRPGRNFISNGSNGININKAAKDELVKLKHVGPVLAGRIISYREKYGPFRDKEGLRKVKGIGEKTYEKIAEQIVLE